MSVWLPAVLSLAGALLGVVAAHFLERRARKATQASERLDVALPAVAVAQASQRFSMRVGGVGVPASVTEADVAALERRLWLEGVERYFVRLREAREALADLAVDLPEVEQFSRDDEIMQEHLERVWAALVQAHLT